VRAAAALLAATVTIAGLTACAAQADPSPAPNSTTSSRAAPVDPTAAPQPTSPDGLSDGVDIPTATAPDETSTAAAVTVAEKLITAYARPGTDKQTWIDGLYPYLTQQGGTAYATVDPAKIPVSQVTGAGSLVDGATEYALLVKVPTNVGDYVVSLTRKAPTDAWLADRITPPAR
jgi:hypothetical protein